MEEIIELLYSDNENKFNYEAVEMARKNKGEINDYLLKEIEKINKDIDDNKIEYMPLFFDYAVFLLTEFKEKRLYPLLINLLNKEKINAFNFYGDGLMEKLPSVLVTVYDGNINLINKVLENKKVDSYIKEMLIKTYIYFYENNIISKDEIETYIRKLIKLYENSDDGINNEIPIIVSSTHLFDLIKDVKNIFDDGRIEVCINGDFDTFIDDIFNYNNKFKDIIEPFEDIVKEMSLWHCFENDKNKDNNVDIDKMINSYKDKVKQEINNSINKYNKVGRNDLCPCGSGRKYKKCCLNKVENKIENRLPYQNYIDESLNEYPKETTNKDEVNFYEYYNKEYIEVDKLLYKAIKHKSIPMFIKRDISRENTINYNCLNKAYDLIKEIISKNNFKTIEEYDENVSIHYSLIDFFDKYSGLIIDRINIDKSLYLDKLEELINYFYDKFNINNKKELVFLDRLSALYKLSNRYEEGINFYEEKLKTSIYNRQDIYEYLFYEYQEYYDYDDAIKRMEDMINKEKNIVLKTYLQEMKFDYMDKH